MNTNEPTLLTVTKDMTASFKLFNELGSAAIDQQIRGIDSTQIDKINSIRRKILDVQFELESLKIDLDEIM